MNHTYFAILALETSGKADWVRVYGNLRPKLIQAGTFECSTTDG